MITHTAGTTGTVPEHALLRVLMGDPRCEADDQDWSRLLPLAERHRLVLRLAEWFARRGESLPLALAEPVARERARQAAVLALIARCDADAETHGLTCVIPDLAQEYPDVGRGVALLMSGPPPDVRREMFIHASASPGRGTGSPPTEPRLTVHAGRLGRLGEQPRLAELCLGRRVRARLGDTACWLPSTEDELLLFTLRFMYGRPSLRLSDALWLLKTVRTVRLDWVYLLGAAASTGMRHGLSCLLDYADQIHRALLARPLYDADVRRRLAAAGTWGMVEWRDGAWHYPSAHVTRRLLLRHMMNELLAGSFGTVGRLALVPVIAAANRRRRIGAARRITR